MAEEHSERYELGDRDDSDIEKDPEHKPTADLDDATSTRQLQDNAGSLQSVGLYSGADLKSLASILVIFEIRSIFVFGMHH